MIKKNKHAMIAFVLSGLMMSGTAGAAEPTPHDVYMALPSNPSAIKFRLELRELWQYQVTWTRSYIVSVLSDLEDKNIVEDKLLNNQEKIGEAVKPYYGGGAGNRLAALLRKHIVIATEIVKSIRMSDVEAFNKAQIDGRNNADAIANLLAVVRNPVWNKTFVRDAFYTHLEYITQQIDFRLKKDWASEIQAYDDGLQHVLLIADLLAEGIIKQFPDQFKE